MNLYKITTPAADKLKHQYIGLQITVITVISLAVLKQLTFYFFGIALHPLFFSISFLPALLVGIYKERQDKFTGKGKYEFADITATAMPGIKISILFLIFTLIYFYL